jgi:hypothetical protein
MSAAPSIALREKSNGATTATGDSDSESDSDSASSVGAMTAAGNAVDGGPILVDGLRVEVGIDCVLVGLVAVTGSGEAARAGTEPITISRSGTGARVVRRMQDGEGDGEMDLTGSDVDEMDLTGSDVKGGS